MNHVKKIKKLSRTAADDIVEKCLLRTTVKHFTFYILANPTSQGRVHCFPAAPPLAATDTLYYVPVAGCYSPPAIFLLLFSAANFLLVSLTRASAADITGSSRKTADAIVPAATRRVRKTFSLKHYEYMLASYNDNRINSPRSMKPMDGADGEQSEVIASSAIPMTLGSEIFTRHSAEVDTSDPHGPYRIQQSIQFVIQQWERVQPIAPAVFLTKLLHQRGHGDLLDHPLQAIDFKR